jgi:hypothetical protein
MTSMPGLAFGSCLVVSFSSPMSPFSPGAVPGQSAMISCPEASALVGSPAPQHAMRTNATVKSEIERIIVDIGWLNVVR